MDSINFLGVILFTALSCLAVYHLYIVFCSAKYKIWKLRYKYNPSKYHQNLNVTVYSHNDDEAIIEALENLKKQDYPSNKVKINIILDNCTDNSSNLLEILGGAKIWRISTGEGPIGRNASIEWFLDKIIATENTNAFLFLDAKNKIAPNLLSNVNNAISEFPVVTGHVHKYSNNPILAPLLSLSEKLKYDISYRGRSMAGLSNFLSTEILAIRQDILERARFIGVKNQNTEIIYSILAAKTGVPMIYSDEIHTFERNETTVSSLIKHKYEEIKARIQAFKYCIKLIARPVNIKTKELILSLIQPSDVVLVVLLAGLISLAKIENFYLGYKLPHYVLSFYIVTTLYTAILARLTPAELIAWPIKIMASPFIFIGAIPAKLNIKIDIKTFFNMKDIKIPKLEFKDLKNSLSFKKEPEGLRNVFVSNGSNDIECKLQEISTQDSYKLALWFNKKRITSQNQPTLNLAIEELSKKLREKGLVLKVCYNCGYFEADTEGTSELPKGKCYLSMIKHEKPSPYSTQVTNNCKFIIPKHAKEYVQKQISSLKSKD